VQVLRAIQPLRAEPNDYVFTTTEGKPIEPKAFASRYWYRCLRALGIRVRGIYCTKDTFVSSALKLGLKVAWLEQQTGVNYATFNHTGDRAITCGEDFEAILWNAATGRQLAPPMSHRDQVFYAAFSDDDRRALRRAYENGGARGYWRWYLALRAPGRPGFVGYGVAARLAAAAGENALALDWLQKAYESRDGDLAAMNVEARYDVLRGEPRFQVLLRKMNFPEKS